MRGFYWLVEGAVAGCALPGGRWWRGPGAPTAAECLDEDLTALRGRGIGAVLSLTEDPLPPEALARHGLVGAHLPVPDLSAPAPEQLRAALAFLDRQRAEGRVVAVHCRMGQGRTGTVLAAYLIRGGLGAAEAVATVRRACPGAIGSAVQVEALEDHAVRRDWIV